MHYTCMHTYKCMKVLHIFCLLSSLNVFRQPGWFSPLLPKSRCFTLVTSLEPASDNNSSTSSWRWKIGTEKMLEKTRRFFSPEKKLLLWSSSASRRVFTWNWKFEIQDVNLFGRFTGNRWWITCWFGLMWFRQYLFDLTRFRQYLWITALGGIMWEPSILLINGSWEFISIFWISLQNVILFTGLYHGHRRGTFLKLVSIENLRRNMQEMISVSFQAHIGALYTHQANGSGLGHKYC